MIRSKKSAKARTISTNKLTEGVSDLEPRVLLAKVNVRNAIDGAVLYQVDAPVVNQRGSLAAEQSNLRGVSNFKGGAKGVEIKQFEQFGNSLKNSGGYKDTVKALKARTKQLSKGFSSGTNLNLNNPIDLALLKQNKQVFNPGRYLIQGNQNVSKPVRIGSNSNVNLDATVNYTGKASRSKFQEYETKEGVFSIIAAENVNVFGTKRSNIKANGKVNGFNVQGSKNVRIEDNNINDAVNGVQLTDGTTNSTVSGNFINNAKRRGVWNLFSDRNNIERNLISRPSADGVDLDANSNVNIVNRNLILDPGQDWAPKSGGEKSTLGERFAVLVEKGAKENLIQGNTVAFSKKKGLGVADNGTLNEDVRAGFAGTKGNIFRDNEVFSQKHNQGFWSKSDSFESAGPSDNPDDIVFTGNSQSVTDVNDGVTDPVAGSPKDVIFRIAK